jgi:hypothetical protein
MKPMLVPEARRSRWSLERWSALAGAGAAVALFTAVVAITTTVGTATMTLPSGHRAVCDGGVEVEYPVMPDPSVKCTRLVRAL